MDSLGGGLGVLGFWLFVASFPIIGIWDAARKRESQHETLRRMIESGHPVDEELMNKILGSDKNLDKELKIAGLIVLGVAPGIAVMGWSISMVSPVWLMPLFGVAALVAFVGGGLWASGAYIERANEKDADSAAGRNRA